MPFSDQREIKIRFKISELIKQGGANQKLDADELRSKTTEWVGMVYRAIASICWNMLVSGALSFEEVKILFTENVLFNFIEFMNDIECMVNEPDRYRLTEHINKVSCEVLEFLCRQYPQTKIEAPNIALRKAIPLVENQGHVKFDMISMISKRLSDQKDEILFEYRDDKDYSSAFMKTINFMIDETESQYDDFDKVMSKIFENIYRPRQKRSHFWKVDELKEASNGKTAMESQQDIQYREKAKSYSEYIIGRKIPKNTPKYSDKEIQYGIFFAKSTSILRIITKWLQELWEYVSKVEQKSTSEMKNHYGEVLNISSKLKNTINNSVHQRFEKIKTKVNRVRMECYEMELLLTGTHYTTDKTQVHLSEDQISVGKYCSNLKDAISSYISSQLSKIVFYLLLVPKQIDETTLGLNDTDLEEEARKHLNNVNLVTFKIFDLLRCKCHSNEEEIIWIVEELKRFEKDCPDFEIVRVKDRLNQGTRDIMINAQYKKGLVWEIQLAVVSKRDKKQDLLDKYNHFLYELKRAQLGSISENVSIWTTLEQRSLYFEQLQNRRNSKAVPKGEVTHKKDICKFSDYSEFKRPIICKSCREYFSIPRTSLLFVRCEKCRVTYCGQCFYTSLSDMNRKEFIFQNFQKKKLLDNSAFKELIEYNNEQKGEHERYFPSEGFFIKKKFLNRELSYFTVSRLDEEQEGELLPGQCFVVLAQTVIKEGNQVSIRQIHRKYIKMKFREGHYYIQGSHSQLNNFIIFYFKNKPTTKVTLKELETKLLSSDRVKILNVLIEPNFMNEAHLLKKTVEKKKLLKGLQSVANINNYKIAVHEFLHLVILTKLQIDEILMKQLLIRRQNKKLLDKIVEKKVSIITMEEREITNEFDQLTSIDNEGYFQKIQKIYLGENCIKSIACFENFGNLETLSIFKNQLKSLKGIEKLSKLTYIKFDNNAVESLAELSNLRALNSISGNQNKIQSLSGIQNLSQLSSLALCGNLISSIKEIRQCKSIQRVYLKNNKIEDVSALEQLDPTNLFMSYNPIYNIAVFSRFVKLKHLKQLALRGIQIAQIPPIFQEMTGLLELKLSHNKIKLIRNIEPLSQLVSLDLCQNQIEKIENLDNLVNLQILKLMGNGITVVEGFKTFLESLTILDLRQNPINDMEKYLQLEEKTKESEMKLKFSEKCLTPNAKDQLNHFKSEIGNKSQNDDN